MLAAVLHDFDRLILDDIPVPEPGLGEVVVADRTLTGSGVVLA